MYLVFAMIAGIIGGIFSIADPRRADVSRASQIFHETPLLTTCSSPRTA